MHGILKTVPRSDTTRSGFEQCCKQIQSDSTRHGKLVFTNGCFDMLHLGHVEVIRKCAQLAGPYGCVVVGLNSDESVRRLKGPGRPVNDEETRAGLIGAMSGVGWVFLFDEDTPIDLIEALRPDYVVKGGDYARTDVVGNEIAEVVIVPTRPGTSTTEIIRRLRG